MNKSERAYLAIDLKSYYSSVECVERGLDPLTTNLVVADPTRTEKTICLAVSPSLRAYGIPGRARLFEVEQKVAEINRRRKRMLEPPISYIVAPPRMALYIERSAEIYRIYRKYVAECDIHVYSVDEVFIDVTSYLKMYKMTARELAMTIIRDVLATTGITATAGVGTNLYLAKVAMDIVAKHAEADEDGMRIAELNEMSYREQLWEHQPITDFWRVGRGYAWRLARAGIYTMGDVARCSVGGEREPWNEELLYKMFGVNAELLIDHAWGWEPCTMEAIKAYRPANRSLSSGQVLSEPYSYEKAKIIVREMVEALVLELVEKGLATNQIVIDIGYDKASLEVGLKGCLGRSSERGLGGAGSYRQTEVAIAFSKCRRSLGDAGSYRQTEVCAVGDTGNSGYAGEVVRDRYGRRVPKPAHGSVFLGRTTTSTKLITAAAMELFERIMARGLLVRRLNVTANNVVRDGGEDNIGSGEDGGGERSNRKESNENGGWSNGGVGWSDKSGKRSNASNERVGEAGQRFEQLDFFTDYAALEAKQKAEAVQLARERRLQKAIIEMKQRYGKNAILRASDLEEGATARQRNEQIGGHRA